MVSTSGLSKGKFDFELVNSFEFSNSVSSCLLFKNKALDRWYSIMKEYKELKVPFASYKNTVNRIKELVSTWQDDSYCEDPSVILCCSKTYKYYFFSSTEISFNNPDSSLVSLFSRERELVAQTRKEEIENALERLERCNSWKDFFLSYALSSESESSALNKNSESSATHNDTTDTNQELSEQTAKLSLESVLIEHDEDSDGESY